MYTPFNPLAALVGGVGAQDEELRPPLGANGHGAIGQHPISPARGDLVVNGGFEEGDRGWEIDELEEGFLDVVVSTADAFSGNAYAEFGTIGYQGTRSQFLSTDPGTVYIVNFHLACAFGTPNSFSFSANGMVLYSIINDTKHGYDSHTYTFTALTDTTTIEFRGQHDQESFSLDDVSVVPLPPGIGSNYKFYEVDRLTGELQPKVEDKGSRRSSRAPQPKLFNTPDVTQAPFPKSKGALRSHGAVIASRQIASAPTTVVMFVVTALCFLILAVLFFRKNKKGRRRIPPRDMVGVGGL